MKTIQFQGSHIHIQLINKKAFVNFALITLKRNQVKRVNYYRFEEQELLNNILLI